MRSATLIAALFSAVAFANPVQIRGTDSDCEDTPKSPYTPPAPSPYGGSTYGMSGPTPGSGYGMPFKNTSSICGATGFTNYTVVSGDTLTTIAAKFSSGICDIASVNNITNPNLIILGQPLSIPLNCTTPDNTTCIPPPAPVATETCVPGLPSTYTVVSGDTLSAIATDFNITLASVIGANPNITNPDLITVGQVINIPVCPSSQCATVGTYTIVSGDLFFDLAAKYHTTVGQIKALNPTVDPTKTQAGDQIILPQNCMNVTTALA